MLLRSDQYRWLDWVNLPRPSQFQCAATVKIFNSNRVVRVIRYERKTFIHRYVYSRRGKKRCYLTWWSPVKQSISTSQKAVPYTAYENISPPGAPVPKLTGSHGVLRKVVHQSSFIFTAYVANPEAEREIILKYAVSTRFSHVASGISFFNPARRSFSWSHAFWVQYKLICGRECTILLS